MITGTEETITAIATPLGRSALGIVRLSGQETLSILTQIFIPKGSKIVPRVQMLGKLFLHDNRFIDEATAVYFEKPHSFTREDAAEVTCHGSPLILDSVINRMISLGARLAHPGEFTYRAFLHGRLDLVQAGAIDDLIHADSAYQAELALQHLDGKLSGRLMELRRKFLELLSLVEGNLDFSEEQHYDFISEEDVLARLNQLALDLKSLLGTFERGRLVRDGVNVAISGRPNVGKSSLFNSLLGQDRAIVTAVPGTTRDFLRERLRIGNHIVNVHDTAGIRESADIVERTGVERSLQVVENAEVIVFVISGVDRRDEEDVRLWKSIGGKDRIVVCNKSDMPDFQNATMEGYPSIPVSALSGKGLDLLLEEIGRRVELMVRYSSEDFLVSNIRHRDLLQQALGFVLKAEASAREGKSEEYPAADLHLALRSIGEITGEITVEDIYSEIFSKFCIGK